MCRLAAVAATAAILISNQSQAQTQNNLLRGLSKMHLEIWRLGPSERECGLTEQAIRAAAIRPLRSTKIEVDPPVPVFAIFNVIVSSSYLQAEQVCFSRIIIKAYTSANVTLEFSGAVKRANVELSEWAWSFPSDRSNHAWYVSYTIEDLVKRFVTDWNLDNKPDGGGQGADSKEQTISLGTGFAVTQAGDLITNEHVVSNCSTATAKLGSREFVGAVAFRDSAADLAVIHLTEGLGALALGAPPGYRLTIPITPDMSFARLRQSPDLKVGDQAIAYGFPLRGALADEGNLTIGNVSAMRGLNNDPSEIQISAPVQPGNSGAPLLDSSGNVIGVVASKLDALNALVRTGDLPQNVNFAISLQVLKAFLARSGVRATESASRFELRPDEVGDRAKSFTYSIECHPGASPPPATVPAAAGPASSGDPKRVRTVPIRADQGEAPPIARPRVPRPHPNPGASPR